MADTYQCDDIILHFQRTERDPRGSWKVKSYKEAEQNYASRNTRRLQLWRLTSSGCGWRNGLQLWSLAANILNKQSRTDNKGWPSSLGVGRGVNNTLTVKKSVTNNLHKPRTWMGSLDKRPKGLGKDRNRWRALVKSVLNLRVP
jgi:hypothetical protein